MKRGRAERADGWKTRECNSKESIAVEHLLQLARPLSIAFALQFSVERSEFSFKVPPLRRGGAGGAGGGGGRGRRRVHAADTAARGHVAHYLLLEQAVEEREENVRNGRLFWFKY